MIPNQNFINKIQLLKNQLDGELFTDNLHKILYATDASVYRKIPVAVAFPSNNSDIQKIISFANKHIIGIIPRAAGTSLAGQCVGEGIVVDISKHFTKILDLDIKRKTVTVEPGVIRDELNQFLEPHGLFFGPNTSTSNRCMIGGMVGNNSSGTTSIKYGTTRDKLLEVHTILSNGTEAIFSEITTTQFIEKTRLDTLEGSIFKTLYDVLISEKNQQEIHKQFPKKEIHRRNTGYALDELLKAHIFGGKSSTINIAKLLAGSEGTLAFTTKIKLQLDVLPPKHRVMVVAHYKSIQNCLLDVSIAMKHDLHTCEMLDDTVLDCTKNSKKYEAYRFFIKDRPKALLLLEIKANTIKDLENKTAALVKALIESDKMYASVSLKGEDINKVLELRKAGLGLLGNMIGDRKAVACIEDTAVAIEDLLSYIKEFTALMEASSQEAVYYAHAGAGELHLRPILNLKQSKDVKFFRKITTDVAHLVKKYQGSFSGEHGDGIVRGEFLPLLIGEHNYDLIKKVKTVFDTNGIFNPGKIVNAYKMDESLRYQVDREEPQIKTLLSFEETQGILRLAENCNGSGDCRKTQHSSGAMCPSYQATKNEKDTTRGRANVLREVLTTNEALNKFDSETLKQSFDLCISCKACGTECPSNVDMATAKAEFLYQYKKVNGSKRADKVIANSTKYYKLASKYSAISNLVIKSSITLKIIKNWGNIASERSIPVFSTKSFSKYYQNALNQYNRNSKNVFLFIDEFSNYLDANIAKDAFNLLIDLGYCVTIIDHMDSARAMISKGFLEEAKIEVNKNIAYLKPLISSKNVLIGIEPSAILGFRDEYKRMADDIDAATNIADNAYLIEEFLASEIENGTITAASFTSEAKTVKIHNHCHQKALSNQKVTFDMLNLPENYTPTIISSGCCGMAGSFGYEKEHYDVSMQIGELKLFPAIRRVATNVIIAANGTSCRHQIKDGTGRDALHPVTILKNALKK